MRHRKLTRNMYIKRMFSHAQKRKRWAMTTKERMFFSFSVVNLSTWPLHYKTPFPLLSPPQQTHVQEAGWVCMLPCHLPFQLASPHLIMDCILFPRTPIKGQFKGNSSSTLKCLIKQCSLLAFCTGYLLHCCNKIPEHSNLTKEGFLGSLCGWRRHSSKSVRQLVTLH